MLKLVCVADLIGKDIAGVRADLRSRFADGELMYGEQPDHKQPRMVTMTRVYVKRENKQDWLRWEWDGRPHNQPLACGFSGVVMDGERERVYHIEIEESPL